MAPYASLDPVKFRIYAPIPLG